MIGGGASGLTAAIAAARKGADVCVLERGKRVGKKILATGNGRCNLTNIGASRADYHGGDTSFIDHAAGTFWVRETLEMFSELGVLPKVEDGGKVYPYSGSAASVLDVLRRETERVGAETVCGFDVSSVKRMRNGGFKIAAYDGRTVRARGVIIACGGKAAPDLGSNGSGYELLRSFGHTITPLSPSLVQIKTAPDIVKKLKGIKTEARVTIGEFSETGELLFTDYGLSGPPVFSLSSRIGDAGYAEVDLMPEYAFGDVLELLRQRAERLADVPLEDFFTGMLNKRVGQALLKSTDTVPLSRKAGSLSERELKSITAAIKRWRFELRGTMSWNNAQVTKGGAVTSEFDPETMGSRLVKGLYACGEVLDIDGDCGGYNLQWAWSSGYIAGSCAAAMSAVLKNRSEEKQ